MKVIKFGGYAIGSVEGIEIARKIIEEAPKPVVVVVSAFNNMTDTLYEASRLAAEGNPDYLHLFQNIAQRHYDTVAGLDLRADCAAAIHSRLNEKLEELKNILQGVFLINDLSRKTSDKIVSYGEQLSSLIFNHIVDNSILLNAMQLIKTEKIVDKHFYDKELTNRLIRGAFQQPTPVSIIPGFISSSRDNNEITNLGRGGSDYTAAIFAAALDASELEIWTEMDGFMTADPKIISNAYTIEQLTFTEATELCNFGARVIYPPTIYPVYHKNIPIRIRNIFNLSGKGTYISDKASSKDGRAMIKGISSINDTCLLTVQGLGMVGIIGVNYRIFKALAKSGISVFLVSQAASENNTSIGVKTDDAELAVEVLEKEFAQEIALGSMNRVQLEYGLATVAIVGENMKYTPGIAGKLFATLGRSGISVIACAQGASERNISFVIRRDFLKKAINSIHDSFFLSQYKVLNLFIVGVGVVGSNLIDQIKKQQQELMAQFSLKLNVVGIARGRKALILREGIDLDHYRELLEKEGHPSSPQILKEKILEMNIFNAVFVDCTASEPIAALYEDLISKNISVVTANKIAASSSYETYSNLKRISRERNIKFLFETNVGAGLPIINTMNSLINSGDRIVKIEAVLSGTLNYIFNTISSNIPFSKAVLMAKEEGFAEPDPRIDLSGTDVVRKLVILTREAGYKVEQEEVKKNLFIPQKYFDGSIEDFWENLPQLDAEFEQRREKLESAGKHLRFVAKYENGRCEIGLQEVGMSHPFYDLEGSNNIIQITTERYNEYPMIIKGYGAGASVTAAGVFADIISIANIR
jgi:aspartokinase/homoserine dehydrogenase 1